MRQVNNSLKQEISQLKRKLKESEESIGHLQFQLDKVMNTRRWRFVTAISQAYHYLFDYINHGQLGHTDNNFNPYEYVKLLKDVKIQTVETGYKNLQSTTPFSTATTVYNEGKAVAQFLTSIEKQSILPSEVVLVDGGSTDDTVQIIENYTLKSRLNIVLIKGKRLNIPRGRNLAIKYCHNEVIVLADAGTILNRHYCQNLIGALQEYPEADLVGGIYHAINETRYAPHYIPDWQSVDWSVFLPSTRSMLLKKSLALQAGLYPEYLQTGDDTLFDINYRRISNFWVFNKKVEVMWDCPKTKSQDVSLAKRYGYGDGRSGIGDFAFYSFMSSERKNVPIKDPFGRANYYLGYVEGRSDRARLEIEVRHIRGVIVLIADLPIHDKSEFFKLWFVKLCIARNYKVIYVNRFSRLHPDSYKRHLDIDYTLLELYAAGDFDLHDVMRRYREITAHIYVIQRETPQKLVQWSIASLLPRLLLSTLQKIETLDIRNYYQPAVDCQIPQLANIYEKYFGRRSTGFFVEVGAYDGSSISNTAFLADLGWRGLYVEPVPHYAKMCRQRHKNNQVKTRQLAVGSSQTQVKVNIGGDISTTLNNPKEFYASIGFPEVAKKHTGKSVIVDQVTLDDLLHDEAVPTCFDLLVLDTEGTEWEILKAFEIDIWRPKMVIVEMHEQSLDWNKSDLVKSSNVAINKYFSKSNYRKIYSDDINTIFVSR